MGMGGSDVDGEQVSKMCQFKFGTSTWVQALKLRVFFFE